MVLRQGLILSALGVAIGVIVSFAATPLLSSFLYGVHPHDALTLLLMSGFLIAITVLATVLPAHRATKVDPMMALRHD
jgi:ABC-type antimicrobial peptide transport system permease subunit